MRSPPRSSVLRSSVLWFTTTVFAGWTAVGLFAVAQSYVSAVARGADPDTRWLVWGTMSSVWIWALLTPAIWWLGIRFRVERGRLLTVLPVHVASCFVIALVDVQLDLTLLPLIAGRTATSFWPYFVSDMWLNVFSYFALLGIVHAVEYKRLYRREHQTAKELSDRLSQARLEALRAHLHPHFLFNAVNGAAELVHESPEAADRMLTRLGALLRRAFDETRKPMIRLEEELSFAEDYLGIARLRFGDRLTFSISATEEARDARVPDLLLQPILENAVRHGIEPEAGPGTIRVDALVMDAKLILSVADTGPGLTHPGTPPHGRGLLLIERLLHQTYGDAFDLHLQSKAARGTTVQIRIPYVRGSDYGTGI